VSGGELFKSIGHQADRWASLKLVPGAHFSVFLSSALLRKRTQNCGYEPDAVKIYITDCPPHVKRNSLPSAAKRLRAPSRCMILETAPITPRNGSQSQWFRIKRTHFFSLHRDVHHITRQSALLERQGTSKARRGVSWNHHVYLIQSGKSWGLARKRRLQRLAV